MKGWSPEAPFTKQRVQGLLDFRVFHDFAQRALDRFGAGPNTEQATNTLNERIVQPTDATPFRSYNAQSAPSSSSNASNGSARTQAWSR
jgi:hypothetical protein